ncbi:MAG: hypothetical protein AB8B85_00465 [Paracoccaceae bacterium]
MGSKGFDKQNNGMNPKSNEVRVTAVKNPMFHGGAGLHEMVPTNQASKAVNDPELSAAQSGLRSSTSLTCFQDVNGIATKKVKIEVGMHSNAAINLPGSSKYTKYQQAAHDKLRKLNPGAPTARRRLIERAGQSISIHAHGQQILESQYPSGMIPNLKTPDKNNHGQTLPPTAMGAPAKRPDDVRLHFAMVTHQLREKAKDRVRTEARYEGMQNAPVSPSREQIDDQGNGGGYFQKGGNVPPPSPRPNFSEQDPTKLEADVGAWMTAPLRPNFDSHWQKQCHNCGYVCDKNANSCRECNGAV